MTTQPVLFNFSRVSEFIIPRREFCGRLIAVVANGHRIIGYPTCISDNQKYDRNDLIFNFCFVLDERAPWAPYTSIVKKMARVLRSLEEQSNFLSTQSNAPDDGAFDFESSHAHATSMSALCEMIHEDLNNYSECMIPINTAHDPDSLTRQKTADDATLLNLKLFPLRPQPPVVHTWHVPLSLVRFSSMQTVHWDLTVQRVIPFIDGINSISIIATLADTDLELTVNAITHLVYYGCILLLDIFSFNAIYAPTPEIAIFVADEAAQEECRRYIASPVSIFGKDPETIRALTSKTLKSANISERNTHTVPLHTTIDPPSSAHVMDLYFSLRHGQALREWCLAHASQLSGIDVRRFITFGIIKGFLYRIHRYAVASARPGSPDEPRATGSTSPQKKRDMDVNDQTAESLSKYLDGLYCMDAICTELKIVEKEAIEKLKSCGGLVMINK